MSVEVAERLGQVPFKKSARCPPDSGIAALAAYLAEDGAKTLEQEELDPVLPELHEKMRADQRGVDPDELPRSTISVRLC